MLVFQQYTVKIRIIRKFSFKNYKNISYLTGKLYEKLYQLYNRIHKDDSMWLKSFLKPNIFRTPSIHTISIRILFLYRQRLYCKCFRNVYLFRLALNVTQLKHTHVHSKSSKTFLMFQRFPSKLSVYVKQHQTADIQQIRVK